MSKRRRPRRHVDLQTLVREDPLDGGPLQDHGDEIQFAAKLPDVSARKWPIAGTCKRQLRSGPMPRGDLT